MSGAHRRPSEAWFIEQIVQRSAPPPSPEGPGDDGAVVVSAPDGKSVVTMDTMVEGVHFFPEHPPAWLGHKLLAVNLSDVAAMGAVSTHFLLSAAIPDWLGGPWWVAFLEGLCGYADRHCVQLVGGDVVRSSGPLVLTVTAWGVIHADRALERGGGSTGDILMVRGALGRSLSGFQRWCHVRQHLSPDSLDGLEGEDIQAHLRPEPPLDAGPFALKEGASAGMDLSDGLSLDAQKLATASDVSLEVYLEDLPEDPVCAHLSPDTRCVAGEDYGLLVLVPEDRVLRFEHVGFVRIGRAIPYEEERLFWIRGQEPVTLKATPFLHFSSDA